MSVFIHRLSHSCDITAHARGCFIVGRQYRLDAVISICSQILRKTVSRSTCTPRALDYFDIQAVALTQIDPTMGKHAVTGN